MADKCRISIDVAHRFLATFGITKPTKAYERWVKPNGFDLDDFHTVLFHTVLLTNELFQRI